MEFTFSKVVSIIADPVRSKVLWTLLDGRAYTAGELAIVADVSQQNMSTHLQKLIRANILNVMKQGRHRYYQFSKDDFAYAIENLANLIPHEAITREPKLTGNRYCGTCYDHLAGRVAVQITQRLIETKVLNDESSSSFEITEKGKAWFEQLSIYTDALKENKRSFARKCLDWSERKHHLAGSVGAALLKEMMNREWLRRAKNTREVQVTPKGQKHLHKLLDLIL